jgi:regulator of sigma E protease
MTGTLYAILGFIVAIGLLTTVHEYGHFLVARLLRVKVLRFSIGFGKSLLTWHDKLGTEYVIASVPLGGYVKMLDQNEGIVAQNERHLAFNNKSVWSRLLIIAAGPAFNIMFAILAYWGVFMLGIISIVPVLGDIPHGSVAALAGLKSGEEIVAVADQPVKSWEDIAVNLIRHVGETDFINITVVDPATKQQSTHALNLIHWSLNENDENIVKNLGLTPLDPNKPIIGKVLPDYPAAAAGLQAGDIIVTVDDKPVTSRSAFMHQIQNKYDHSIQLGIKRNDQLINLMLTPAKKQLDGGAVTGFIGVQFAEQAWPQDLLRTQHYAPGLAFKKALDRTGQYTILTLQFLRKMLLGQMSLQHVAGPISIAKFAGRSAESGLAYFLGFLALVSISLGVLNMLPIPVLDGGHFMFCIVELIRGKALSQQTIGYCYTMGFVILGGFMLLALYNDITRIMQ